MHKLECSKFCLNLREKLFYSEDSQAQRNSGAEPVPNLGDSETTNGDSHEPTDIADPTSKEELDGVWRSLPTSGILSLCETLK